MAFLGLWLLATFLFPWENLPRYLGGAPTYLDFIGRNQQYYTKLSNACNELLSQPSSILDLHAKKVESYPDYKRCNYRGDDKWLPSTIQSLHSTDVIVESKRIEKKYITSVSMEFGRIYFIKWEPIESIIGKTQWILSAGGEDRNIVVYPTQKQKMFPVWEASESYTNSKIFCVLGILAVLIYLLIFWIPESIFFKFIRTLIFYIAFLVFVLITFLKIFRCFFNIGLKNGSMNSPEART